MPGSRFVAFIISNQCGQVLAVGLKPSAIQGKARLRGLYRIIYSQTIISVAVWGVRFWECSTSSIGFNLCENCYIQFGASIVEQMYDG